MAVVGEIHGVVEFLQRVAVCCSVLQCVAVCCTVLHCVAVCCITHVWLWSVVLGRLLLAKYTVLQCVAVCCSVLQRVAVWYIVL